MPRAALPKIIVRFWTFFSFILIVSCVPDQNTLETRTDLVMDTAVNIGLYGPSNDQLFQQIFDRLHAIDTLLSAQKPNSDLKKIAAAAGMSPIAVSPETWFTLDTALQIAQFSGGAFDPTIGPVTSLWAIGSDHPHVATSAELARLLPLVDYRRVERDAAKQTVFLPQPGMQLDFGGVGKGYAAMAIREICVAAGVQRALINLGNSTILALGSKPDGGAWKVGVQDPSAAQGSYFGVLEVNDSIVETSGAYERFFEQDGRRYHHIIDPKTGQPADQGLKQVTVIVPSNSRFGDGLSSSCYILGLPAALAMIEKFPDAAAILVTTKNEVYLSKRIKDRFTLKDAAYSIKNS